MTLRKTCFQKGAFPLEKESLFSASLGLKERSTIKGRKERNVSLPVVKYRCL